MAKPDVFIGSEAVAEASRDKTAYSGFLAGLFEAQARWDLLISVRIPPVRYHAQNFLERFKAALAGWDADRVDREGEFPEQFFKTLADLHAWGLKIPRCFGGQELTQYEYQQVATLCGSLDASLTVLLSAAQSIGLPEPLRLFGTDEQKTTYLPRLAQGEISGFALTEKNVGCDISKVQTYAVRVKENGRTIAYRLSGEKFFITNSAKQDGIFLASLLLVIARIVDHPNELQDPHASKQYGAFIVETHWPGCSVTRLRFEGVRGIYNGAPTFNNVYVPVRNLLGSEHDGLRIALTTLTIGRLTLPAACLGGLKQCLALMRCWSGVRVQWNKPIGEHTLIGEKLCRAAAYTLALEAIMAYCGALANQKGDLRLESAAAKILGSEWYWEVVNDLFQVRGGRGFMTVESQRQNGEYVMPVMRMLRDARINLVWEGTSEILRIWMAREALSRYIEEGITLVHGTLRQRMAAIRYYARMALRSSLPSFIPLHAQTLFGRHYARWVRFVESSSRSLTRQTLVATLYHRQSLHHKQLLLQNLVNESLRLFPMAAVIWFASQPEMRSKPGILQLAAFFCQEMTDKRDPASSLTGKIQAGTYDTMVYDLARRILRGEYAWLEDGIVPLIEQQGTRASPLEVRSEE